MPAGLLPAPLRPSEAAVGAALGSLSERGSPWHAVAESPAKAARCAGGPHAGAVRGGSAPTQGTNNQPVASQL